MTWWRAWVQGRLGQALLRGKRVAFSRVLTALMAQTRVASAGSSVDAMKTGAISGW